MRTTRTLLRTTRAVLIAALVFLAGCAASTPRERCRSLEVRYEVFSAIADGALYVAGGSAVTTAFPEDKNLRIAAAATALGFGAVGSAARAVRDDVGELYNGECVSPETETSTATE